MVIEGDNNGLPDFLSRYKAPPINALTHDMKYDIYFAEKCLNTQLEDDEHEKTVRKLHVLDATANALSSGTDNRKSDSAQQQVY